MEQIKGVCLNFDGVIADSSEQLFSLVKTVFDVYELPEPELRQYCLDKSKVLQPYYDAVPPVETPSVWFTEYIHELDEVDIFPEVKFALEKLREQNVPVWLVSSAPGVRIIDFCTKHDIFHLFNGLHFEVVNIAEKLRLFCKQYRLDPTQVAYVGNLPSDILEAYDADVCAISKKGISEVNELLAMFAPHQYIHELTDLLTFTSKEDLVTVDVPVVDAKENGGEKPKKKVERCVRRPHCGRR